MKLAHRWLSRLLIHTPGVASVVTAIAILRAGAIADAISPMSIDGGT